MEGDGQISDYALAVLLLQLSEFCHLNMRLMGL